MQQTVTYTWLYLYLTDNAGVIPQQVIHLSVQLDA